MPAMQETKGCSKEDQLAAVGASFGGSAGPWVDEVGLAQPANPCDRRSGSCVDERPYALLPSLM